MIVVPIRAISRHCAHLAYSSRCGGGSAAATVIVVGNIEAAVAIDVGIDSGEVCDALDGG